MSSADLSRIIQGTLTGIGFIGGGVILKMSEQHQIVGITTAASIWLTATVGIAAGTGRLGLAVVGTILAFIILTAFGWLEREMIGKDQRPEFENQSFNPRFHRLSLTIISYSSQPKNVRMI